MARHYNFRHRRHTDDVSAELVQQAAFCSRFVTVFMSMVQPTLRTITTHTSDPLQMHRHLRAVYDHVFPSPSRLDGFVFSGPGCTHLRAVESEVQRGQHLDPVMDDSPISPRDLGATPLARMLVYDLRSYIVDHD
jgi:hypothetical protein